MLEFLTSPIYRVNNFVHDRNPSVERQYFQQQFGFPIKGYPEDIESGDLAFIVEVVNREMNESPFTLKYLEIEPASYFKNLQCKDYAICY